jgi:IS5 family transposase
MMKAPMAQASLGPNPRDRGKNGSKRHLLVDGRGVPLSRIVTGANRHDVSQLDAVLEAIMVKRALPPQRRSKHLRADAGYSGAPAAQSLKSTAPSRTSKGADKRQVNSSATPGKRPGAGWLK